MLVATFESVYVLLSALLVATFESVYASLSVLFVANFLSVNGFMIFWTSICAVANSDAIYCLVFAFELNNSLSVYALLSAIALNISLSIYSFPSPLSCLLLIASFITSNCIFNHLSPNFISFNLMVLTLSCDRIDNLFSFVDIKAPVSDSNVDISDDNDANDSLVVSCNADISVSV